MNAQLAHELLETDRNIITLGYEPSTERGARVLAYRIRIAWLRKGWDIPCTYGMVVKAKKADNIGHGSKGHRDIFGPKLLMKCARRVNAREAQALIDFLKEEMTEWAS